MRRVAAGIVLAAAPAVLARLFGWDAVPLAVMVTALPWLGLLAMVALALAWASRAWMVLGAAAVTVGLCGAWVLPAFTADDAAGAPVLRVATVNLLWGSADPDEVVEMVRERAVDVLAVQELSVDGLDDLERAGLSEVLPYSEVNPLAQRHGGGVWSRLPLDGAEVVDDGFVSPAVVVRLAGPTGPLTVVAPHPASLSREFASRWAADQRRLAALVAGLPGAVVIAGDLNMSRDHRAFRELEDTGFANAADQAGAGLLPTFPARGPIPPFLTLDHVLERDTGMVAVEARTVRIAGTDHRALVVTYAGD